MLSTQKQNSPTQGLSVAFQHKALHFLRQDSHAVLYAALQFSCTFFLGCEVLFLVINLYSLKLSDDKRQRPHLFLGFRGVLRER